MDITNINEILDGTYLNESGIPKVLIVSNGITTYLYVDGEMIGSGCRYVNYLHDVEKHGMRPVLQYDIRGEMHTVQREEENEV